MSTYVVRSESGAELGEVRKVSQNTQAGSVTVWRAVPLSRVAHASSSGCPSFGTRREAIACVRDGRITL